MYRDAVLVRPSCINVRSAKPKEWRSKPKLNQLGTRIVQKVQFTDEARSDDFGLTILQHTPGV